MTNEKITVWLEEEYGYRYWQWDTGMTAQELVSWWSNLSSVGEYFMSPAHLPGLLTQLHDEPIAESKEEVFRRLEEAERLLKEGKNDEAMLLLNPAPWWKHFRASIENPDNPGVWYCHVHMDDDSILVMANGKRIKHAGYEA
jgi:hypothetical protein